MTTISKRDKWSYCVGCVGRDMMFILVSMFVLAYIQYTMKLSVTRFTAISAVMIFARVWDAINDPMMGMLIENTHLKGGKFRPWIMIRGSLNFAVTILLFTIRPEGWAFVMTGITIAFSTVIIFSGLFPRVMVSSTNPEWSLTIYNASSSQYTLGVMSIVAAIFVPLVLLYQGWSYWIFKKRISRDSELEY